LVDNKLERMWRKRLVSGTIIAFLWRK